jgi:hypothetical protein
MEPRRRACLRRAVHGNDCDCIEEHRMPPTLLRCDFGQECGTVVLPASIEVYEDAVLAHLHARRQAL